MVPAEEHHSPGFNALIATAAFVIVVAGIYAARIIVIPLLLAIFIAVILSAIVSWLRERGIKTTVAVTLLILALGLIGSLTLVIVGASVNELIRKLPEINRAVQVQEKQFNHWLEEQGFGLDRTEEKGSLSRSLELLVPGIVRAPEEREDNNATTEESAPQQEPAAETMPESATEPGAAQSPQNIPAPSAAAGVPESQPERSPAPTGPVADSPTPPSAETPAPLLPPGDAAAENVPLDAIPPGLAPLPVPPEPEETPIPVPSQMNSEKVPEEPATPELLPASRFEMLYPNYMFGPQKVILELPPNTASPQVGSRYGGYFSPVEIFRWFLESLWGISNYGLIVFLMLMFLLLEWTRFGQKLEMLPGNTQSHIEQVTAILTSIRQYMFIKTMVSLLTGLLITIWLLALGTQYAALWGTVAFLFNYIPTIGSIIAGIVPTLFVLVDQGPWAALQVGIAFLVVNFLVGNVLEPRIMGEGLGLSTFVVFLSLVFWGFVLGPAGMLVAVPLTMAIKIALASDRRTRWIALLLGAEAKMPQPNPAAEKH